MKYYLKKTARAFIYILLTLALSIGTMASKGSNDNVVVPFLMALLNVAILTLSLGVIFYKEGQKAYRILTENDLNRKRIIETGKNYPLKEAEEYKPYKGVLIGLCVCIPLVFLLLVHLVVSLATNGQVRVLGIIASVVYMVLYSPFAVFFSANVYWYKFFYLLYAIPYFCLAIGLPYYLGGRKKRLQREEINKTHKEIYGDKNK